MSKKVPVNDGERYSIRGIGVEQDLSDVGDIVRMIWLCYVKI